MDQAEVRSPRSQDEWTAWYEMFWSVFVSDRPRELIVETYRAFVEGAPTYSPELCRGIWRDGQLVARYGIFQRELQVGPSRLTTACIGGVATHPDCRKQGLAAAMMRDAVAFAESHGISLLLLAGISDFYHRFGYVDCWDAVQVHVARERIAALPPPACQVREVVADDAPALLSLYHANFDPLVGSFDRTLTEQQLRLSLLPPQRALALAVDDDGQPRGYLTREYRDWGPHIEELVALDADAISALLQRHVAALANGEAPPEELAYNVPRGTRTAALLEDLLPQRRTVWSTPRGGWMARIGNLDTFVAAMLPVWAERWRGRVPQTVTLQIDGVPFGLVLGEHVRQSAATGPVIQIDQGALTQLLFGYRAPSLLLGQGLSYEPEVLPTVEALFPPVPAGIAGTDDF